MGRKSLDKCILDPKLIAEAKNRRRLEKFERKKVLDKEEAIHKYNLNGMFREDPLYCPTTGLKLRKDRLYPEKPDPPAKRRKLETPTAVNDEQLQAMLD